MDRNNIITLPHDSLRQTSSRVRVISDDVKQLIKDMKAATIDWENSRGHEMAVGLAAVQVDVLKRVLIIRNDFDDAKNQEFTVLIDPEITKREGEPEYELEGCLSVKDIYGKVGRYPHIRLRALNENGQEIKLKLDGFLARVLQHEVDHLQGKLFIDRVEDNNEFYELGEDGKMRHVDYEDIEQTGIFG